MTTPRPALTLAPFRVRSFRFQWPADLFTSLIGEAATRGGLSRKTLRFYEARGISSRRQAGSVPCVHLSRLLEEKAADLEDMLGAVRATLNSWRADHGHRAAVCPQIEGKGRGACQGEAAGASPREKDRDRSA